MRLHPLSKSYRDPLTYRCPRSLAEAFPNSDGHLEPIPDEQRGYKFVTWLSIGLGAALVLSVLFCATWLPGGGK